MLSTIREREQKGIQFPIKVSIENMWRSQGREKSRQRYIYTRIDACTFIKVIHVYALLLSLSLFFKEKEYVSCVFEIHPSILSRWLMCPLWLGWGGKKIERRNMEEEYFLFIIWWIPNLLEPRLYAQCSTSSTTPRNMSCQFPTTPWRRMLPGCDKRLSQHVSVGTLVLASCCAPMMCCTTFTPNLDGGEVAQISRSSSVFKASLYSPLSGSGEIYIDSRKHIVYIKCSYKKRGVVV